MTSRAFGKLPKPIGNNARLAPSGVELSGAPQWAMEDIEKLNEAGILVQNDLGETAGSKENRTDGKTEDAQTGDSGTDSHAVSQSDSVKDSVSEPSGEKEAVSQESADPSGTITGKELKTLVRRIYALYGTELKDDFYAAVNKKDLDTKEIPSGETDAGGTYDQRILVQKQVNTIIKEIVEGDGYAPGSMEQKIKEYYESALDFNTRNALGAEPIRKYLEAIENARSMEQLSDAQIISMKEVASGSFLGVMYMTDTRDTQKTIPTLMPAIEPEEETDETQPKAPGLKRRERRTGKRPHKGL